MAKRKKEDVIKVLICNAGESPKIEVIDNDIKPMQEIVGGYVQMLQIGNGICLLCNEDGLMQQLQPNFMTQWGMIVGNVIFAGERGQEFASLNDEQIYDIRAYLLSVGVK
jgi:hypothetical protein